MADRSEPIALIGIGCRFPEAGSPRALWQLLIDSGDAIREYDQRRFPEMDAFYAASAKKRNGVAVHRGGFLSDIDQFEPQFFELSFREAMYMDPQYRLLLEVAWEALEDAGQTKEKYTGSRTGVYTGVSTSDYEPYLYQNVSELDFYMMIGGGRASASGRLSFNFGFEGPGVTVDTACSSSLVATHMACQALRAGEIDMALAGGVHLILETHTTQLFAGAGMLARDGHCKFGDTSADGFVRSEGCGVVVLKRLSDAVADNDPIYAVIRGSAINNDGRTNGLMTTPSIEGQQKMLRQAWGDAGIDPRNLRYIEAHGTGTSVGDPVEVGAIGKALAEAGARNGCHLGSIKTNIGHAEAASGVAGLIKAALALKHRQIPPSLHQQNPNPAIDWDGLGVKVLTQALDLSKETAHVLVGVNSFGLSGTNAHIVLEEHRSGTTSVSRNQANLFTLSAQTESSLQARIQDVLTQLESREEKVLFSDLCYTSTERRSHLEHRAAIVAENNAELESKLKGMLQGETFDGAAWNRVSSVPLRVVFIAPGQGSQWNGMTRELFRDEPAFRNALKRCDAAIQNENGWSLIDRIFGDQADAYLREIDVVQPALFAISVSLAELWRSWGVEPNAVVGHSMGEAAAACISDALSLEDATAVICRRSRLMKTLSGHGSMASVELPAAEVEKHINSTYGNVSIAAINSPGTTVVAGDPAEIDSLLSVLEQKDVFCRLIKVDVASHSSQVDPILDELVLSLGHLLPKTTSVPVFSTVEGRYLAGTEMSAQYWSANLRQPVLLANAVQTLARDGHTVFIELSPHPILLPSIEATLKNVYPNSLMVPSLRRGLPERSCMLASAGALFAAGLSLNWRNIQGESGTVVSLPPYPFQRERCWPDDNLRAGALRRMHTTGAQYPFLGAMFESSLQPEMKHWEVDYDLGRFPYLKDHKVRNTILLPAAAHIETALEAAHALRPGAHFDVAALELVSAIPLSESEKRQFQIVFIGSEREKFSFQIRSRIKGETSWTLHSSGRIEASTNQGAVATVTPAERMRGDLRHASADEHYRSMEARGIHYGPSFQLLLESWTGSEGSLCRIQRPREDEAYLLHPAFLDACFQSFSRVANGGSSMETYLPVAIERLSLYHELPHGDDFFVWVSRSKVASESEETENLEIDIQVMNVGGLVLFEIERLKAQRVSTTASDDVSNMLLNFEWLADETESSSQADARQSWLIISRNDELAVDLTAAAHKDGIASRTVGEGEDIHLRIAEAIAELGSPTAVIYLDKPYLSPPADPIETFSSGLAVAHVVQALGAAALPEPPKLWLISHNAMHVEDADMAPNLNASTLWGMGIVALREKPELRSTLIDLSTAPGAQEIDYLIRTLCSGNTEERLVLREDRRYVARLTQSPRQNVLTLKKPLLPEEEYCFETLEPGLFDNLALRAIGRTMPGPGEVAIEVAVAGLNFFDVAKALGIYPGLDPGAQVVFGAECSGKVAAIGPGVTGFSIGDEVIVFSDKPQTKGTFTSYLLVPSSMIFPLPSHLSMEEGAVLPAAYSTAYHSLIELARLKAGEWVLLPSATGGVGLAAIEIAHQIGAHVIGTAGTPEKRAYLEHLGVYALPSRSLAFAEQAMQITNGRGVDVILNSLIGEYLTKSLELMASGGRFIELGKRDIYDDRYIGLKAFRKSLSYHVVDLATRATDKPQDTVDLFQHCMRQIAEKKWKPLPVKTFSATVPDEAFRFMASSKHIGKIAVRMDRAVEVLPRNDKKLFRQDATYILTGAYGGVGSAVAEWMAENGAGHLVMVSRRSMSDETRAVIESIEKHGATAMHVQGDIADEKSVSALMAKVNATMPPLRGVMHAAAIIDDQLIQDLDAQRYFPVLEAKIRGAWNLHSSTLKQDLDFFVMFSSAASIYTQPGMGSYAAANAFLDAFAHYRRGLGLKATSINWGGWREVGLAREEGTRRSIEAFEEQGLRSFSQSEGLNCLHEIIKRDAVQAVVFPIDPEAFAAYHKEGGVPALFSRVVQQQNTQDASSMSMRDLIAAASSSADRREALEAFLQQQLAVVLRCSPEKIERDRTLGTMGLDSLMSLEFVRRVNAGLGTALSATAVFNYPTIQLLSRQVAEKLGLEISDESELSTLREKDLLSPAQLQNLPSEEDSLRELMGETVDGR